MSDDLVEELFAEIEAVYSSRYIQPHEMAMHHLAERVTGEGRTIPYRTLLDSVTRLARLNGWTKRDALTDENRGCVVFSKDGMTREGLVDAAFNALTLPIQPGELTARMLAERMGLSIDTARKRLHGLEEAGKLERIWRKTDKGHGVTAWRGKTNGRS